MKWLIVSADDLGLNARRNAGILEAIRKGIVTSTSILVYGPAYREAIKIAKALKPLDIGLHLNLSEGEPLVIGHKTLVGPDGKFWGKQEARRRVQEGLFNLAEVEKETSAQLETLNQSGIKVSHINGHHHIHILGAMAEPVARAAVKHGVRCFRLPIDKLAPEAGLPPERLEQIEEYREAAHKALEVFVAHRMRSTENFIGIGLTGKLTLESLQRSLKNLPEGLTELMVHPGYASETTGFEGPDRELELKALTDASIRALLTELQIGLTHFGKL